MEHCREPARQMKKKSLASAFRSTSKQQSPSIKSVSFPRVVSMRKTMSIDDYTDDEIGACWYNRDEIEMIEKCNAKLAKLMSAGEAPNTGHSYRGLEGLVDQSRTRAEDRIEEAIDIILDYYDGQCMHGVQDEAALASLYASVTKRGKLLAMATGLQDEIEAELAAKEIDLEQQRQHHKVKTHRYMSTERVTGNGSRRRQRTTVAAKETRNGRLPVSKATKSKSHKKSTHKKTVPIPSSNMLQATKRSVPPAA